MIAKERLLTAKAASDARLYDSRILHFNRLQEQVFDPIAQEELKKLSEVLGTPEFSQRCQELKKKVDQKGADVALTSLIDRIQAFEKECRSKLREATVCHETREVLFNTLSKNLRRHLFRYSYHLF